MARFLFTLTAWATCLCLSARAEPLEPIGAQGPSARQGGHAASAYHQHQADGSPTPSPAADDTGRRLMLGRSSATRTQSTHGASRRNSDLLANWAKSSGATAAAALAFVIGLFMLLAWFVKQRMPKSSQVLPAEAVRMLGRVPLGSRQFGHLLQLGNKLVLVSVSPTGVEKLAELDDPQEVVRLVGLCGKTNSGGSQKEFEEIFGQLAGEKTEAGFLGREASLFSTQGAGDGQGGRRYA